MPLFGNKHKAVEPTPAPVHTTTSPRSSGGFFSRRRSSSPSSSDLDTRNGRHGHTVATKPARSSGLFHRDHEDGSIVSARERVLSAETAEREADRALMQARTAVKDARNHVKLLEKEAAEE